MKLGEMLERLRDARDHQMREERESHARRMARIEIRCQLSIREERFMHQ